MDFSRFGIALASWHSMLLLFLKIGMTVKILKWKYRAKTGFAFNWKNLEADIPMSVGSSTLLFYNISFAFKT